MNGLYLRPSCHNCKVKEHKSGSDIKVGDFWGVETIAPHLDDNLGISIVYVNTKKGEKIFEKLSVKSYEIDAYPVDYTNNKSFYKVVTLHKNRAKFFKLYTKNSRITAKTLKLSKINPPLALRIKWQFKRVLKMMKL